MASEVVLPKQGNSVESCVILEWRKNEGDQVKTGEIICEVETDKATFEVESTAEGLLLKRFFEEGDDVPVLTVIAAIGKEGEDVTSFFPEDLLKKETEHIEAPSLKKIESHSPDPLSKIKTAANVESSTFASPRAKKTAAEKGIKIDALSGSGPGGRIIERDVLLAKPSVSVSPAAIEATLAGVSLPLRGSGIAGRILYSDVVDSQGAANSSDESKRELQVREIPLKGVRKLIAQRMHASLLETAQLTLNSSADVRELQAYRKQCKAAPEEMGISGITINDMILFAVSRILAKYSFMNAQMFQDKIVEYKNVNLAFAVDTEKGLMVPVIKNAHRMSLKTISAEAKRLGRACIEGKISPDELNGGTFTVSNLGSLGVAHFTPVLNAPQVGILGVGCIELKPVQGADCIEFIPNMALSLTIDHRAVDGAPAARFLKALTNEIANFRLSLAD